MTKKDPANAILEAFAGLYAGQAIVMRTLSNMVEDKFEKQGLIESADMMSRIADDLRGADR